MRTGIATIPLDYGKCPPWLFERMKRLSRGILIVICEEFGSEELLKRLADPIWFQSLGCTVGFDWNSSGLTTTTLGALKEAIRGIEDEMGIYICGGKGKTSRKTPEEIRTISQERNFSFSEKLVYSSKMIAKVDSCLIQAGFQIYQHNFIFTKDGKYVVIQQGMNTKIQKARRYHWLSLKIKDFTEEPHAGIISDVYLKPLNLVAKESRENTKISTELIREEPKTFLRDMRLICKNENSLIKQKRLPGFCEMELEDKEFFWHPLLNEKFDLKRLKKIVEKAHFLKPNNFEQLLITEGVGPKTIRALSLVSELIYGAKPSYEDPARYSFCVGGKDGTPRPIDYRCYDEIISILEKGIQKAKISIREKKEARKRMNNFKSQLLKIS